jgi:hypothetical protein
MKYFSGFFAFGIDSFLLMNPGFSQQDSPLYRKSSAMGRFPDV